MSETAFRIFNGVYSVGAELTYALSLALFLRPFLKKTGRARNLWLIFTGYLLVSLLCAYTPVPQGTSGLLVTALLTAAAGALGLERSMAVLLSILCWSGKISSVLMVESLYFIMEQLLPTLVEPLEGIYLRAAAILSVFLLLHTALMAAMLYGFQRRIRKRRMALHRRELCYLCLMPSAGILFGQLIARLWIEFQDGVLLHLYTRHPAFLAVVPLLALLFYGGTYLSIAFQQGMAALREEQAIHYAEYQQIQAIQSRIDQAEQFYARVRRLKHEMRGHLTNIKGLVRSGAYASLEDYVARMDESMSDFALTLQTGNPVTDVIVNDARRRCEELGIHFQADFQSPAPEAFAAFDVGIILQNLLQNAVEACEKVCEGKRFIVLTGTRTGRFFLIEVKNSFAGEVIFGQDDLPVTSKKEDAPMHGIGLSNVRREAEKYMGELELKTDRHEFSATVLLQERSN